MSGRGPCEGPSRNHEWVKVEPGHPRCSACGEGPGRRFIAMLANWAGSGIWSRWGQPDPTCKVIDKGSPIP